MNVAQLISKLGEYPADTPVILAREAEGNDFGPASAITVEQVTSDGEVIHEDDVDEWGEDDLKTNVVLWP